MADFIPWKNEFTVGIEHLDAQHKELNRLINRMHSDIAADRGVSTLKKTFDELTDYAIRHFEDEEAFMEKINYPGLTKQRSEHRLFLKEISEYEMVTDKRTAVLKLFYFLIEWFSMHLRGEDKKLDYFLEEQGIRTH